MTYDKEKAALLIESNGGVGMPLEDLLECLTAIRNKYGGHIRVVCAPRSYSKPEPKPRKWWQRLIGPDPKLMCRTPEPSLWGLPGYDVGPSNPPREITL